LSRRRQARCRTSAALSRLKLLDLRSFWRGSGDSPKGRPYVVFFPSPVFSDPVRPATVCLLRPPRRRGAGCSLQRRCGLRSLRSALRALGADSESDRGPPAPFYPQFSPDPGLGRESSPQSGGEEGSTCRQRASRPGAHPGSEAVTLGLARVDETRLALTRSHRPGRARRLQTRDGVVNHLPVATSATWDLDCARGLADTTTKSRTGEFAGLVSFWAWPPLRRARWTHFRIQRIGCAIPPLALFPTRLSIIIVRVYEAAHAFGSCSVRKSLATVRSSPHARSPPRPLRSQIPDPIGLSSAPLRVPAFYCCSFTSPARRRTRKRPCTSPLSVSPPSVVCAPRSTAPPTRWLCAATRPRLCAPSSPGAGHRCSGPWPAAADYERGLTLADEWGGGPAQTCVRALRVRNAGNTGACTRKPTNKAGMTKRRRHLRSADSCAALQAAVAAFSPPTLPHPPACPHTHSQPAPRTRRKAKPFPAAWMPATTRVSAAFYQTTAAARHMARHVRLSEVGFRACGPRAVVGQWKRRG
jgi:hypothetical protein